jgi:hypothetical protein
VISKLKRHAGFNGADRTDLGAGHTVPAVTRLPAIGFAVFTKGHQVSGTDLLAQRFILGFASIAFAKIYFWSHISFLLGG